MSSPFILSISNEGVKTMEAAEAFARPHAGDWVDFSAVNDRYPFTDKQYGRIDKVYSKPGHKTWVSIICETGSAHLFPSGGVSMSGGPFAAASIDWLEQTYTTKDSPFWNWGNGSPGAHRGVYFKFARPVWKLTTYKRYEEWTDEEKAEQEAVRWG